jgi:hypothetical protein
MKTFYLTPFAVCALVFFWLGVSAENSKTDRSVNHPPTAIKHEVWQLNKRGKVYFYVDHQTRLLVEDCVKKPDGCVVAEQLDEPAEVIVGGKKGEPR